MIYDCFPFFREFDLLEIRLNTLKDVVDTFVIAELNITHSGKEKEFYLQKRWKELSKQFHICYVAITVTDELAEQRSWIIENWHRRFLKGILGEIEYENDDYVLLSDVDEIPRPEIVAKELPGRYEERMYYFHLNTYAYSWTAGTVGMTGASAKNKDWQQVREDRELPLIKDAGWHFSSVGRDWEVRKKMESFAHTEFDTPEETEKVMANYEALKDIWGSDLTVAPLEDLPNYVQDNKERFDYLLWENTQLLTS